MIRYIGRIQFLDVIIWNLTEPGMIGFLCVYIQLTRKKATSSDSLQSEPETTNAGKQIDKCKGNGRRYGFSYILYIIKKRLLAIITCFFKHLENEILFRHSFLVSFIFYPVVDTVRYVSNKNIFCHNFTGNP